MEIIKTADFESSLARLPKNFQSLYKKQEERFLSDWRDPRLHTKKVQGLDAAFSFRITRNYRTLFYFTKLSVVVFFDVDHRRDVYRKLH